MIKPGPLEIGLILVVILVIFGIGKVPQVGAAFGKSLRAFRRGQTAEEEQEESKSKAREEKKKAREEKKKTIKKTEMKKVEEKLEIKAEEKPEATPEEKVGSRRKK